MIAIALLFVVDSSSAVGCSCSGKSVLVDVIVEDRNSANSLDYLKCVIRGAFVKGLSKVIFE